MKIKLEEMKHSKEISLEELKSNKELSIKRLELEATNASITTDSSTPGTSTPISRSSPAPVQTRDTTHLKPKSTLSSEVSYLEMLDWKQEALARFKASNFSTYDVLLQRQLLKQVMDEDSWVRGKFTFTSDDDFTVMIDKLCAVFEWSLPLFNLRQQYFDMKRGKSEALYTYMIKLQLQAMAAKLDTLSLDGQLTHKLMSDEGVSFCKKVVQLKKEPTYQELLEIARFDEEENTISGEQGRANAAKGGGSGG